MRANGINAIRQILSGTALSTLLQSVFSVFSLALLFYYSWQMALLALGLVTIAIAVSLTIAFLQLKYQKKTLAAQGRLAGTVLQFLSGLAKLRTSGCEARAFAIWTERFVEMKSYDVAANHVSNVGATFNSIFSGLCTIAIFSVYFFFMKGALATGDFLSYNAAFGQFMGSLMATSSALITLLNAAPIYERARPILTTLPEVDDSKSDPGRLKGGIEISHLNFSYTPDGNQILKGVNIQVKPGQFVAVVGSSGSGKSTIMRLLIGFEKAPACSIFYDGQDLHGLDVFSLRRQIGVVLQNGRILSGDIFHNITGASRLTVDDAWAAAEAVGLAEDIRAMPMGMHTHVAEGGSTLSGGQRQRLLLARAMVHRPPILMLDEATSALDNRTQEMVSQSMRSLNVSRLVIAHRLSTIVGADRIYVLDHGIVVQEGSYEELLKVEGPFRELSKRQIE
jgi:ATP-binding cassette subfamily C protein